MTADEDFIKWAQGAVKGMKDSAMFMQIFTADISKDPTPALQLGYAMMLDKPIVIVAPRGTPIPENIKKAARAIAFFDQNDAESVSVAVIEVLKEAGLR